MPSPMIPSPLSYNDISGGGVPAVIVIANTAPTVSQNQQGPGTFWIQPQPGGIGALYYLAGFPSGVPNWVQIGSSSAGSLSSLTATAGNISATNGNLVLGTAGNKLVIATGTNSSAGTSGAMVAGVITISSTAITATSQILYSRKTTGGTTGEVSITAQADGSFTLTSSSATETSTFNYLIIN